MIPSELRKGATYTYSGEDFVPEPLVYAYPGINKYYFTRADGSLIDLCYSAVQACVEPSEWEGE